MVKHSPEVKKPRGEVSSFGQLLYANAKSKTTADNAKLYRKVYLSVKTKKIQECMCASQMLFILKNERDKQMKNMQFGKLSKEEREFWNSIYDTIKDILFW